MRVAIVGGGIAGLSAAYELEQARAAGNPIEYTLFEAGDRLGGVLAGDYALTADRQRVLIERGPDSFLTEKPAAAELCRELGLEGDLIPSNDADRKTWIVVRNRLIGLPDGLMFLVPTKLVATALSPLFSWRTKIRMALDLLHPPWPTAGDESVAALITRHYGAEVVERLADPLLSGIYGGDAAQLSARAVLPRLVEIETRYGSLTRGMLAARKNAAKLPGPNPAIANHGKAPGAPRAIFTTLRYGLSQLSQALAARLSPESVRCNTPVTALGLDPDPIPGADPAWRVTAGGGARSFDAVILAAPAWAAAALLRPLDEPLAEQLAAIPYSSSIAVNLVYEEAALGRLPDGFGFLVPAVEGRALLACTFLHRKFLGRIPPGKAVLRAFLGGIRNAELLAESDARIEARVRGELKEILGVTATPELVHVQRWPRNMAQYAVGHRQRVRTIAERAAALPGLRLVGNAYDGIGISDCIRLGRQAAKDLAAGASPHPDPSDRPNPLAIA